MINVYNFSFAALIVSIIGFFAGFEGIAGEFLYSNVIVKQLM